MDMVGVDEEAVPRVIRQALENSGFDLKLTYTNYRDDDKGCTVYVQEYLLPLHLQPVDRP